MRSGALGFDFGLAGAAAAETEQQLVEGLRKELIKHLDETDFMFSDPQERAPLETILKRHV